jgi:hypothetical protein
MHEELNNFKRNKVWELVERPKGHNVIETKRSFITSKIRLDSCKEQSKISGSRLYSS